MLEQRENIKIVGLKPKILMYISDVSGVSDLSDKPSSSDKNKNKDSFLPDRSDTQDRKEDH